MRWSTRRVCVPQVREKELARDLLLGGAENMDNAAEFGRIGRYYALEDMLTTAPADKYGKTTLAEHYARVAVEGQDFDPYTTVFGGK